MVTSQLQSLVGADFLDLAQLQRRQLERILELAATIKSGRWPGTPLAGKSLALLFQKPSIRTRVSFEVAINRLGGHAITLQDDEIGIGRRETAADVARVLDRYVDGIVARLFHHADLLALADGCRGPVINALTDASHPCQVLADLMTMREAVGRLDASTKVVFVGDGNNVVQSLMEAATLLRFQLVVICPPGYRPRPEAEAAAPDVQVSADLSNVAGASIVYTDVWTSMGQESEAGQRRREFLEYQVDEEVMQLAPEAIFMHCLPAHRGEEVSEAVLEGQESRVFDQAENRLHVQMALLALLFQARP
ncbi:MAG: ornithine carbamoyltransferase [Candidatus Dormibacteraeota bacterium]|nr:ornithine carbamoyltransferase [Candidatus Dormibacteraeota bacterium]